MIKKLYKSKLLSSIYSERMVFTMVLVGLAGAIIEIFFFSSWVLSDRFIYGFFGNVIFLNTLHALISYRLLGYSVFKAALLRGIRGQMKTIIIFTIVMFILLCSHYYVEFNKTPLPSYMRVLDTLFVFYSVGFLRSQHTAYQAYGILQNYNDQNKIVEPIKEFITKEKQMFLFFFFALIISSTLFFSRPFFKGETILRLQAGFSILAVFFAVLIIRRSVVSHGFKSKRTMFGLRFLLQPLKYYSLSAAFFNFSCHGVEYFWITKNIEKNCEQNGIKRSPLKFILVVVLFLSTFAFLIGDYLDARPEYRAYYLAIPVILLTAISQLTSILHFYMDRIFFRFKDEKTFQEIGPLLRINKDG